MPLYVYVCRTCGSQSEHMRKFADRLEPADCPECAGDARFALSLSTPSFVGSSSPEPCGAPGGRASGGCCGGGACGAN